MLYGPIGYHNELWPISRCLELWNSALSVGFGEITLHRIPKHPLREDLWVNARLQWWGVVKNNSILPRFTEKDAIKESKEKNCIVELSVSLMDLPA